MRNRSIVAEISPAGAIAGHTMSGVLVASGIAFVVASSDELWRRCSDTGGTCGTSAAAAGLVTLSSVALIVAGVVLERRVRSRPVDPEGSSRLVAGLGVLFALGLLLVAWRIPAFTCDRGRFDEVLELCMHPPSTSEPTAWGWVKASVALLGIGGGVAIGLMPRWAKVTAPLAILAWIGGAGWFMVEALVRA